MVSDEPAGEGGVMIVCGYLDPGTGSFLLQIVVGAVIGSIVLVKGFWKRLCGFMVRLFSKRHARRSDDT